MNRIVVVVLGLLSVFLAALCFKFWKDNRAAESALAELARERSTLQGRVGDLEKRGSALQTEAGALRQQASADRGRPQPGAFTRSMLPGGPGMQALESPEMRSLMALDQKGRLDSRYAALFKALKLPPAQLDKLKQLLVDKQSAPMDVFAEARAQGLTGPENAAQIRALLQATNQEIDENVRATLGDAAFEQYQQYERTLPQRNVVDQLANRLSYSDDPLSAQQTEQLVALLAASSPPNTAGGPTTVNTVRFAAVGSTAGASPMMIGGPSTPITSEAVNNASSLLSAAQLEALRQIQAEQQAQQQMSRTLQQSFGGPGNSTNISVPGNTAPSTPARPPND